METIPLPPHTPNQYPHPNYPKPEGYVSIYTSDIKEICIIKKTKCQLEVDMSFCGGVTKLLLNEICVLSQGRTVNTLKVTEFAKLQCE